MDSKSDSHLGTGDGQFDGSGHLGKTNKQTNK